jgi:hypothetical protein
MNRTPALAAAFVLSVPIAAGAHSFGRLYNLPVPFWMYLYGAAAALVLSFLVVAFFVGDAGSAPRPRERDLDAGWVRALRRFPLRRLGRGLGVFALLLCMVTGFFGSQDAYANLSMTLFWVVFVLGFTYLSALVGGIFAVMNPWMTLVSMGERVTGGTWRGRFAYPPHLGVYPALALYMAFIWIELFGGTTPFVLATILLAYTALNLLGAWLVGRSDWFRHVEFFGVYFRLIGRVAPLTLAPGTGPGEGRSLRVRAPFVGLLNERAEHFSVLLFVLFMLSSTSFDGLRETQAWYGSFWLHLVRTWAPVINEHHALSYAMLQNAYLVYQSAALLLSPFFYLALVLACMALAKGLTGSTLSVRALALRFADSLLPIALVYHVSHYYTLVLTQGAQLVSLASDPFGFGWTLFGTAAWRETPFIPDAGFVWHSQVALILFGHLVSVYLAHVEALRLFPTPRKATLSQLPMLLLMLSFTTIGLWILSLPIGTTPGGD